MRTLFLVRDLRPDEVSFHLAEVLSAAAGASVVFVCDERNGRAQTSGFPKISLTPERLRGLGITRFHPKWGWFWGDLCYYAAVEDFPHYDAYCLVESDVYMSAAGAVDFVDSLEETDVDVVASHLKRGRHPKRYSKPLQDLGLDPKWGCIFPITRLTKTAVQACKTMRLRTIAEIPDQDVNDEGVLVGAMQQENLSYADLEDVAPSQVFREVFDTNPPYLFETLMDLENDTTLYHPVYTLENLIHRLNDAAEEFPRQRLLKIWRMASSEIRDQIRISTKAAPEA